MLVKANTFITCSVTQDSVGPPALYTLTPVDGTTQFGEQAYYSIQVTGLDTIELTVSNTIDDKPEYMYIGFNEWTGKQRHTLYFENISNDWRAKYVGTFPGLTAWLDTYFLTSNPLTLKLEVATERQAPAWNSAHLLPGQGDWWCAQGIVNGYWTILNPDDNPPMQTDAPGARSCFFEEYGMSDVAIEATYVGHPESVIGGPLFCVNPDDNDFGLVYCYESGLFDGTHVLWQVGRRPDQVSVLASFAEPFAYAPEDPKHYRVTIEAGEVTCYCNGEEKLTATVPAGLLGATKHGVELDINSIANPRPKNLPLVEASSFSVRQFPEPTNSNWIFATGTLSASGIITPTDTIPA